MPAHRWTAVLALSCLGFSAICFSQQIYKWKDAAGIIHYSEQPPPEGVRKTQLKLSVSGATESAPKVVDQVTSGAGEASALDKADSEQEKHLCSVARQNLKLLDSDSMIASGGDIKTATQLVGEQREGARGEAKAQVKRYCHEQ